MIINLDIDKQNKTTDYGINLNQLPPHHVYFRIHDKDYSIPSTMIDEFKLIVTFELSNKKDVIEFSSEDVVELNDEKLFKWRIPNDYVIKLDKINITPQIIISNVLHVTSEFKIIIFKENSIGMDTILTIIQSFNNMYNEYLKSIKRFEIGQPNGIIPLNDLGKIRNTLLQKEWTGHLHNSLYNSLTELTGIHGLRINEEHYQLEYYDSDDDEWYIVNSLHGGKFSYPHKESPKYDVFGGYFQKGNEALNAGSFTQPVTDKVRADKFNNNVQAVYDAGLFTDDSSPVSGGGFTDKKDPVTGGGFS